MVWGDVEIQDKENCENVRISLCLPELSRVLSNQLHANLVREFQREARKNQN